MRKNLILIGTLCGISSFSFGQSVLTAATSNPVALDAFTTQNCDTTGVQPGSPGANMTWDFSGLTPTTTDTAVIGPCSLTPYCSMYTGSNFASASLSASNYTYVGTSATTYSAYGSYYSSTNNVILTNPGDILRYPFTYLSGFTDTMAGSLTNSGIMVHQSGIETVVCDGWGTLKLPGGIIDTGVLRVHTTQTFIDSTSLFGGGVVTVILNNYAWYKPNYHSFLFQVSTTTQAGSVIDKAVAYAKKYPLGIDPVSSLGNSLIIYPNPASNLLNIRYNAGVSQVRISLSDMTGREVAVISDKFQQGAQQVSYNTSTLPKGLYFVRIQNGSESVTRKIEIL